MTRIVVRSCPAPAFRHLCDAGIHPVLARIFASRGITEAAQLSTGLSGMIHPEQLSCIGEAAAFLADTIAAGKKITVIADYDCDGATACALALLGLRLMGARADYMVPNRFDNGYGLTPAIVDMARENHGTDVLVTVYNGIASLEGI